jgi:excisionase family DNA binding protein
LVQGQDTRGWILAAPNGEVVDLSDSALRVLCQAIDALASDQVIFVRHSPRDVTVMQAADFLGLPYAHIVRFLDEDVLPSRTIRDRQRIRFEDVMTYRRSEDVRRSEAMTDLVRLSEEMGLYEMESVDLPPTRREP